MSATHVVSIFPNFALVIAGDANVWLPYFRVNRQRSRDNAIFPYIQQLLDLGLTIINPQSRATHVAGAALDLVFVSTHLECDHFTVHQGDSCCEQPACCPSLTSDHFLCTWSLRGDQRSSSPGGQSNTRSVFPRVQSWLPVLRCAHARLASWAEDVKALLSRALPSIVSRTVMVDQLFGRLCDILWSSALESIGRRRAVRHSTQPRWWNDECYQAVVCRNGAWRDYRRSGLSTDYARFSQRRLVFHRVVRRAKRGFWSDWQEQVEGLRRRDPRVCVDQIRRCFRHPGHARVPHESMVWSANSTPSSPQDHHVDPCAQWRRHFSEITLCQSSDFDPCFAAAVSDQFRACCADQSSGDLDAPFSEPELVRAWRLSLASALISPQSWCLVRLGKCPLAQSRWTASISQWYALTGTSASF